MTRVDEIKERVLNLIGFIVFIGIMTLIVIFAWEVYQNPAIINGAKF